MMLWNSVLLWFTDVIGEYEYVKWYTMWLVDILLSPNYDSMPREVWGINGGNIVSGNSTKGGLFITDYKKGGCEICDIACWCYVSKVDKGGLYVKDIASMVYILH